MRIHAEANLSALIESTEDLIWSVDPRLRLITFNRAFQEHFERNFGGPVAPGMSLRELLPPERMVTWPPLFERALKGERFRAEITLIDGRILDLSFSPIVLDGETTGVSVFGKDITVHKRAMQALQESEERFRRFFEENSSVMLMLTPSDGEIVAANQAACEFYGYPKEQFVGMHTHQINNPPAEQLARDRETTLGNRCSFFTYRNRRSDGEERDVEIYSSPVVVDGRTLLYAIVHDVTDRKQAEQRLQESEQRYRATFELAPVGIVHVALDGRYLRCNERFAEIIGYTREEVTRLSFQQITLSEDINSALQARERLRRGESETLRTEKQYIRKDDSRIWVRVSLTARRDNQGLVQYFIAIVEDIQTRKDADERLAAAVEALRLSESRYRTAFQTSIDPMCISRLKDGEFIDVNQAFLRAFGCKREEVVGKSSFELNIWKSPSDRRRLVNALRKYSVCHDLELQLIKPNGQSLSVLVSGSLIELDGVPSFLLAIRDITETKAAEQRLAAAQYALRSSEERHRQAFQTSPHAVTIVRLEDGMLLDVNETFLDTMGYEREEVLGRTTPELAIWADPREMLGMMETLRRDQVFRGEVQLRKKSGEIFWGRMSVSLFEYDGVHCSLSVTQDITAAKAAEQRLTEAAEALRRSEQRYRTAFQTSIDSININRLSDGLYIDCNQAFLDTLGYTRQEVIGKTSLELNVWADPRDRMAMQELVRQNSHCRGLEIQFKKKNGEVIWGEMSASPIEIDGVECLLSITRDVSHVKVAENTIRNLAFYDSLTGLPNRRFLSEKLNQIQTTERTSHSQALLFLELDHFKTLNETLGHLTGDLLLKEVAQRIRACIGESDVVCRLGGDEFAVMLDELSESAEEAAAQTKDVGERIRASIGQSCLLNGRECITTASIGCTVFGAIQQSTDELMQEADIALYNAKLAGRNAMRFFSPALQSAVNARATLEEDMRQAIKCNQFLLFYQPQVQRGRLIGAEALIRWMHPKNGMVPPDAFIPLAEETGLILPVGDWVLDAACRQIATWAGRKSTAHLTVAVNISALQFRQLGFVETVLKALERTGANPKNLKLELTESMLVENIEDVIAKMTALKEYGLSFSLDDFGTGYSSLTYLKRLPLDQLKIDRAFVRDMLVDVTSGAIAQTIISLGRAMGLSVIAEGVETDEQRGFLAGLGCHAFQGTLFSPPLPLAEFEAFI